MLAKLKFTKEELDDFFVLPGFMELLCQLMNDFYTGKLALRETIEAIS